VWSTVPVCCTSSAISALRLSRNSTRNYTKPLNEKGCIPRLYRHAKRGRITNPKLGGRTVILSDDFAAYLRELPILGVRAQRNTA
jgi:hypothetical protein